MKKSEEACCNEAHLRYCTDVTKVNTEVLLTGEDINIVGYDLAFISTVEPNGFVYRSREGDEAIITWNQNGGNMFASLKTRDPNTYISIEKCQKGYVFKQYVFPYVEEDTEEDTEEDIDYYEEESSEEEEDYADDDDLTSAEYSIMFYYTQNLLEAVPDIEGFIEGLLIDTNEGYKKSKIPLTARKHCMEMATIREEDYKNTAFLLKAFRNMKGDKPPPEPCPMLRKSADVAVLIVNETTICGRSRQSGFQTENTYALVKKSCARTEYSFGHEIGHLFGAHHNNLKNKYFPLGHGHLIDSVSEYFHQIL